MFARRSSFEANLKAQAESLREAFQGLPCGAQDCCGKALTAASELREGFYPLARALEDIFDACRSFSREAGLFDFSGASWMEEARPVLIQAAEAFARAAQAWGSDPRLASDSVVEIKRMSREAEYLAWKARMDLLRNPALIESLKQKALAENLSRIAGGLESLSQALADCLIQQEKNNAGK